MYLLACESAMSIKILITILYNTEVLYESNNKHKSAPL